MYYTTLLAATTFLLTAANRPDGGKIGDRPDTFKVKELTDISGYYACSGKEGLGKTYNGVAVITKKNDVYLVQWIIGTGGAFFGIGLRQGDTLSCSWAIPGDKGVVLRFQNDQLPAFTLWKNTGGLRDGYVTGLEPGTNYPNPRPFEQARNRVVTLPVDGRYVTETTLQVLATSEAVAAVEAENKEGKQAPGRRSHERHEGSGPHERRRR